MKTQRKLRKQTSSPRSGVVMAMALACLFLAILLCASLTVSTLDRHRRLRDQVRDYQARWLAESAVDRAVVQLRLNADYRGEVWTIPGEATGSPHSGQANITVTPADGDSGGHQVMVEALYPDRPVERVRVVREITLRHDNDNGAND